LDWDERKPNRRKWRRKQYVLYAKVALLPSTFIVFRKFLFFFLDFSNLIKVLVGTLLQKWGRIFCFFVFCNKNRKREKTLSQLLQKKGLNITRKKKHNYVRDIFSLKFLIWTEKKKHFEMFFPVFFVLYVVNTDSR
jgi:hypothetical protein